MHVIRARNVNDALTQGLGLLRAFGVPRPSRNGPVLLIPEPVTTVYSHPCERVLLDHPWRDANPFFHLVESLWMLAGRDTLKDLTPYVARMAEFSDDGGHTQPGAYGARWRRAFTYPRPPGEQAMFDQLNWVVKRLRKDPHDRRAVITMWDPNEDPWAADHDGRDVPCNLTALPWVDVQGRLCLTVFCRSNDVIWGAYGANAVHFSVLLEYLAGRLGLPVGTYTQVSNNYHAYLERMPELKDGHPTPRELVVHSHYDLFHDFEPDEGTARLMASEAHRERFIQQDLDVFFEHGAAESATKARWPFLRHVAVPMALAHQHWRKGRGEDRYTGALEILDRCRAEDWRLAGRAWISKRYVAWANKEKEPS